MSDTIIINYPNDEGLTINIDDNDDVIVNIIDEPDIIVYLCDDLGTTANNYDYLDNKPSINNVELVGNKTLDDLGIEPKRGDDDFYITNEEKTQGELATGNNTLNTLKKVADKATELDSDIYDMDSEMLISAFLDDKYIHETLGIITGTAYKINIYDVSTIGRCMIKINQFGIKVVNYAWYMDSALTQLVKLGSVNQTGTNYYEELVYKPEIALYLAISKKDDLAASAFSQKSKIDKISTSISALNTSVSLLQDYTKKLSIALVIPDKAIHFLTGLNASVYYNICVIDLADYDKVRFKSTQYINQYYVSWAFYQNVDCTGLIANGQYSTVNENRVFDVELTKPSGGRYLAIVQRKDYEFGVFSIENIVIPSSVEAWGDSLTAGSGGNGISYPSVLADLIGGHVYNYGIGGENSLTIGARHGGIPMKLSAGITLPADTSLVSVTLSSSYKTFTVAPLIQGSIGVNPVIVDGIECTLSYTSGMYYLQRLVAGRQRNISVGTPIFTNGMKLGRKSNVKIYGIGTNVGSFNTSVELIEQYKKMISFGNTDKVLLLGLHSKSGYTQPQLVSVNTDLKTEFGAVFVDILSYMVNNAIYDAIELGYLDSSTYPTAQDLTDIGNNIVPTSLRYDAIHFNQIGYRIEGHYIYSTGKALGYWN